MSTANNENVEIGSAQWFDQLNDQSPDVIKKTIALRLLVTSAQILLPIVRNGTAPNHIRHRLALETIRYCRIGLRGYTGQQTEELMEIMTNCAMYAPVLSDKARIAVLSIARKAATEIAKNKSEDAKRAMEQGLILRIDSWLKAKIPVSAEAVLC